MNNRILVGAALSLTLAIAGACSSSGGGGGGGGGGGDSGTMSGVGEHHAVAVKAADGGTVTATGVSVAIPAGALAADTTITVDIKDKSTYSGASNIAVNVFELGPSGTKFSKPVPLTLDLGSAKAPTGMTPVIAYYDGSAWQPLADSAVSGTKVTGSTTHFTPFTIVWSNGMQTGGGCASLDFTPCGGSLVGTWSFTAGCYQLAPGTLDPTKGSCPQVSVAATVDLTGSVTFNSGGTFSSNETTAVSFTIDVPAACLADAGITSCASLGGGGDGGAAAMSDGKGGCTETQMQPTQTKSNTGTYTTSGNQFTATGGDGGSGNNTPLDYCVSGTTLKAKQTDSKGNTVIYVATKQ